MAGIKGNSHFVIKIQDAEKYLDKNTNSDLDLMLTGIALGRKADGKEPTPEYYICNLDEPYSDEVLAVILKGEDAKNPNS